MTPAPAQPPPPATLRTPRRARVWRWTTVALFLCSAFLFLTVVAFWIRSH